VFRYLDENDSFKFWLIIRSIGRVWEGGGYDVLCVYLDVCLPRYTNSNGSGSSGGYFEYGA